MPKSFLVKKKKPRRAEDGEAVEPVEAVRSEDTNTGKTDKITASLKPEILFIPYSTWPFDKRFCSLFLPNISCATFTVIKCHKITGADVAGRTVL